MPVYGNYISNPSFELGTSSWSVKHPELRTVGVINQAQTSISRVTQGAVSGSYALRISVTTGSSTGYLYGYWGGAYTIVQIDPAAGQPYTLSWQAGNFAVTGASSAYNQGLRVGVWQFSSQNAITVPFQDWPNTGFQDYSPAPLATKAASKSTSRQSLTFTPAASTQYLLILFEIAHDYWDYWTPETLYTARCTIDAIKLEQGTVATAYGDGSYAGWTWSGAPHNSPSLRAAEISSSGFISVTGAPVEILKHINITASGNITVSGAFEELTAEGTVSAFGDASADGSIDLWLYSGEMEADGNSAMIGTIELAALIDIEAHGFIGTGTGADTPKIELVKAWGTQGAGSASMDGSITLQFPINLSGSTGTASVTGTAHVDIGLQMSSDGSMTLVGDLELTDAIPPGAFADFAIFGTSEEDPYKLGVGPTNAPLASGAQNQPWTRVYAEFSAPADQPSGTPGQYVWRRAAYAAVGFRFANMGANTYQELTCVQVETSRYGKPGPRDYQTPQTITPLVIADRANFATGDVEPSDHEDSAVSVTPGGDSPAPGELRKEQVCTKTMATDTVFVAKAVDFVPGRTVTFSCWLRPGIGVDDITVRVVDVNDPDHEVTDPVTWSGFEADTEGWARVHLTFMAREKMIVEFHTDPDGSYPQTFSVAGILWEESDRLRPYFDMQLGSGETYYRHNGEDPTQGVFLYKNIDLREPVLIEALRAQAPLGVRIGWPEYGKFPHLD